MADAINADNIRASLAKNWQDLSSRNNCSGFLRNVAKNFDIKGLDSVANGQIEYIMTSWESIPTVALAADEAAKGWFVVAVLRGSEHADHRDDGHVAIVLPGPLQVRGSGDTGGAYPFVWCAGGKGGQSDGTRTVGDVWRPPDRNHVHYYKYKPQSQ